MKTFTGFTHGIGVSGWLTNYKRMATCPPQFRTILTEGDREHFASFFTREDVLRIRDFGMDHIRLGFDQLVVEEYERPGVYREEQLRHIDDCIGWCKEAGLNVVLNLHKGFGAYCDVKEGESLLESAALRERFIRLWEMLERRYHAEDTVAFEILNEVVTRDIRDERWDSLVAETTAAIRSLDPTRKLIIGSTVQNSLFTVSEIPIDPDENVIYTFHFYVPYEFCAQRGVLQANNCFYNREMPYPGDISYYKDFRRYWNSESLYDGYERMDRRYLYDRLQTALDFMEAHPEKILYCGEFGTIVNARLEHRENWFYDVIGFFKAHGIPYCVWNYRSAPYDGNRFSLTREDTGEILSQRLLHIINGSAFA